MTAIGFPGSYGHPTLHGNLPLCYLVSCVQSTRRFRPWFPVTPYVIGYTQTSNISQALEYQYPDKQIFALFLQSLGGVSWHHQPTFAHYQIMQSVGRKELVRRTFF